MSSRGTVELSKPDERPDSDYDAEQLKKGIKVEVEHGHNDKLAKRICKDHLDEFPTYYTALDEMETKLKTKESFAPSEEEVITFLKHHPNPSDDDLHSWAELHGYEPDQVEEVVYRILTKKLNERVIFTPAFGQTIITQR